MNETDSISFGLQKEKGTLSARSLAVGYHFLCLTTRSYRNGGAERIWRSEAFTLKLSERKLTSEAYAITGFLPNKKG